jgi:parallel beta-helix repeat protein
MTRTVFISAAAALVFLCTFAVAPAASAAPTTREVGAGKQYATIQSAINASANGDTVRVAPGSYTEDITISRKYISVVGDAGATIRSAGTGRAVVYIDNVPYVAGGRMILTGFTITGGVSQSGQGGGITVAFNASPEIINNVIDGNRATTYGGGISVHDGSNPLIRGNTIIRNSARDGGAGIFVVNNSSPTIYGNTITNNTTSGASIPNGGSSGGGIYLENTSNPSARSYPVVMKNTIGSNSAAFAGGGIMVRTGVNATIEGNTIESNTASYGGGLHVESTGSNSTIADNVIRSNVAAANAAFAGSGFGGGIALYDSSVTTIRANVIEGNQASNGGGGIVSAENANGQLLANRISGNTTSFNQSGNQEGGGLYVANSTMTASNNQFYDNSADIGGAIALLDGSKTTIANNTIVRNVEPTLFGGAIFVRNLANVSAAIRNNVLSGNQGYQIFDGKAAGGAAAASTMDNNLLTAGSSSASGTGLYFDYAVRGQNSAAGVNNLANADRNISADPAFSNAATNDFSLTSGSPAINAGAVVGSETVADDFRNVIRSTGRVDAGAFQYEASPIVKQHVYRFWSSTKKGHFFTISEDERNGLVSASVSDEWRYESVAYDAFTSQVAGTIPLYRFYSAQFAGHFYTTSVAERDQVIRDYPDEVWLYENVGYYVYPVQALNSRGVVRFWNAGSRHHFYTANAAEATYIQANQSAEYAYEGQQFNVPR